MKRRLVIGVLAATAVLPRAARAEAPQLRVWRDPGCGCCGGWVDHMRGAGFRVEDNRVPSVAPTRRRLGIPFDLISCHAAEVAGYALEGHVPAAAVRRLLTERPSGLRGLAVPGMPIGSPGMEAPGQAADTYEVIAFDSGEGRRVFMRFQGGREA